MSKLLIAILLLASVGWLMMEHKVASKETNEPVVQVAQSAAPTVQPAPVVETKPEPKPQVKAKPVVAKKPAPAHGEIQELMKNKVIAKWGEGEWNSMLYIMQKESGSNPYAVNKSSGACGIPQALPCSKLLKVIGSLENVDGQLDWMISYVSNRYGDPTKAVAFHKAHNWY